MRHEIVAVVTGTVIDDECAIPLAQLCRVCGVPAEKVIAMVEEGILEPVGRRRGRWLFPVDSIRRARTAIRLQRDLELNLAGAALALDLLDRVEDLRSRLRSMEAQRGRHRSVD